MRIGIYAMYDMASDMIVGRLELHRHDAAAIRWFGDLASMRDSLIGLHPRDYQLLSVGSIDEEQVIAPERRVVLEGHQWAAMQVLKEGGNASP